MSFITLDRKQVATVLSRGGAVGLVMTLVEALKNIPPCLAFRIEPPIQATLVSVAFNLVAGIVLSLVTAPLLKLRRGGLWHALCLPLLGGLLMALPPRSPGPLVMIFFVVLPLSTFFLSIASFGLARWRWARWAATVGGSLAAVVALAVPYYYNPSSKIENKRQRPAPDGAPNVLLIVLDTVRGDRLGVMGYERDTFPWLGEFARGGAVFERALSPAPWTLPAHASIFTGLYPSAHGAHHEHKYLQEDRTTLAETMRDRGWVTVALSSNPWIASSTGMTQGFMVEEPVWMSFTGPNLSLAYRVAWHLGILEDDKNGRRVTDTWLRWLDTWDEHRPFFAFLNYIEPHFPYHEFPREYRTAFSPPGTSNRELVRASNNVMKAEAHGRRASATDEQNVRDLYDSAILYQNDLVAQAVEALRKRGVLDDTIVVLVSDHGDLLGEYGGQFHHNRSLAEELLKVPLIIRYPPRVPANLRITTPVTTVALMPTILELAGLAPPENLQGLSFASLFDSENETNSRSPLLAEVYMDKGELVAEDFTPRHDFDRLNIRYRSIEEDGWKLVMDSTGRHWLFQAGGDQQGQDLSAEHPEEAEHLEQLLASLVEAYSLGALDRDVSEGETVPAIDSAVQERLRALGYVK